MSVTASACSQAWILSPLLQSHTRSALSGDPSAWGLAPVTTASKTVFQPSSKDSLSLNLIGEHVGGVQWPEELAEIVHVHSGLAYAEYYEILGTMVSCTGSLGGVI